MDCRTTVAHKFRTRLGFKPYDVILTKQQSVLTKIKSLFEGKIEQRQYSVLGYRTDLYFHGCKFAIEIDENVHRDIDIDSEIKRHKAIEKEIDSEFIRNNSDKDDFDIFKAINEIFRYIKQSSNQLSKKVLIVKISKRLLSLELKSIIQ